MVEFLTREWSGLSRDEVVRAIGRLHFFPNTRSYAALRAADLDWIIGPGYSLGGYILEKNHENQPGTMKKHEKPMKKPTWNHEKP